MTSIDNIETIGSIAPAAGSLIVLVADAETFNVEERELHPVIQKTIVAWPENWQRGDRRDIGVVKHDQGEALVFALRGWNMMAGVYRLGGKIMIVDPGLDFWITGGGLPQPARGHDMATEFLSTLMAAPNSSESLGELYISSGWLLVADAWQACNRRQALRISTPPGSYRISRHRLNCSWDSAVNEAKGIQLAVLSPTL